jgi:cell division protein ZapA
MSVVDVRVGTRNFQLACENGQEEHLSGLASEIDKKLRMLSKQMRTNNEPMLLLMTALMMQDELNEIDRQGGGLEESIKEISKKKDDEMAEMVNTIADYLEDLIGKVEK